MIFINTFPYRSLILRKVTPQVRLYLLVWGVSYSTLIIQDYSIYHVYRLRTNHTGIDLG